MCTNTGRERARLGIASFWLHLSTLLSRSKVQVWASHTNAGFYGFIHNSLEEEEEEGASFSLSWNYFLPFYHLKVAVMWRQLAACG